jgi:hypothetical protein
MSFCGPKSKHINEIMKLSLYLQYLPKKISRTDNRMNDEFIFNQKPFNDR